MNVFRRVDWVPISFFVLIGVMLSSGHGLARKSEPGVMCGMMNRTPKIGISPDRLPDPASRGAITFARVCSQCHVLPSPKSHSAEEWEALVERMAVRMAMMGPWMEGSEGSGGWNSDDYSKMMRRWMGAKPMGNEEKWVILDYLKSHALGVLTETEILALKSKEGETFKKTCSECHDLPDPKLFAAKEWPDQLGKMKVTLKEYDFPPLGKEEEQDILKFLEENAKK